MKIEEIKVVKVDDVSYPVESLSDDGRTLVDLMNDWRVEEVKVQSKLAMVRAAIRDLTNELISVVRNDVARATQAAEASEVEREVEAESE